MNEVELKNLWQAYDKKLEKSLAMNYQLLKNLQTQKATSALRKLKNLKTGGIIAGILYLLFLGMVLFYAIKHYSPSAIYFVVSVSIIFVINIKAVADYVKHLVWVNTINYEGSITEIQQKLSKLQLSIIQHAKMMCLSIPFYTTFYLSPDWFPNSMGLGYILFQLVLTGSFVFGSFWMYKNLRIENANKKWFSLLVGGSGGTAVKKAMEFLNEIEAFQQE